MPGASKERSRTRLRGATCHPEESPAEECAIGNRTIRNCSGSCTARRILTGWRFENAPPAIWGSGGAGGRPVRGALLSRSARGNVISASVRSKWNSE